jgi:hypothetical protein
MCILFEAFKYFSQEGSVGFSRISNQHMARRNKNHLVSKKSVGVCGVDSSEVDRGL